MVTVALVAVAAVTKTATAVAFVAAAVAMIAATATVVAVAFVVLAAPVAVVAFAVLVEACAASMISPDAPAAAVQRHSAAGAEGEESDRKGCRQA